MSQYEDDRLVFDKGNAENVLPLTSEELSLYKKQCKIHSIERQISIAEQEGEDTSFLIDRLLVLEEELMGAEGLG